MQASSGWEQFETSQTELLEEQRVHSDTMSKVSELRQLFRSVGGSSTLEGCGELAKCCVSAGLVFAESSTVATVETLSVSDSWRAPCNDDT